MSKKKMRGEKKGLEKKREDKKNKKKFDWSRLSWFGVATQILRILMIWCGILLLVEVTRMFFYVGKGIGELLVLELSINMLGVVVLVSALIVGSVYLLVSIGMCIFMYAVLSDVPVWKEGREDE